MTNKEEKQINQSWDMATERTKSAVKENQCQAQAASAGNLWSSVVKPVKFPETSVTPCCQGLRFQEKTQNTVAVQKGAKVFCHTGA